MLTAPNRTVVITCDATVATACPGLATAPAPGVEYYYLFKHGVYPGDSNSPYPQMTGKDLKLRAPRPTSAPPTARRS